MAAIPAGEKLDIFFLFMYKMGMSEKADHLFNQLNTLGGKNPPLTGAVENIKKDWQSAFQPHGNIRPPVSDSLCESCKPYAANATDHLEKAVKEHQSIHKPKDFTDISSAIAGPLRRAVTLSDFLHYHINESFRGKNLFGQSFDRHGSIPILKREYLARLANGQAVLEIDELNGSTGPADKPNWWTFFIDTDDIPVSGETYMKELALDVRQIEEAERDKLVLEVLIPTEILNRPLFKPTALDAFVPETKFAPELTGYIYGNTKPDEPALQSRPETVGEPVTYRDLPPGTRITVNKYHFRIYQ